MQAPSNTMTLGDAEVRVEIEAVAPDLPSGAPSRRWIGVAGSVAEINHSSHVLKHNDEVIAYVELTGDDERVVPKGKVTVPSSRIYRKPKFISCSDAASMGVAYFTAFAILEQELNIQVQYPFRQAAENSNLDGKRVLIAGGETDLGIAMLQILRSLAPECKIAMTISMNSQYNLLQRCSHTVALGAKYAIDGACSDLMDHLRADMESTGDKTAHVILDVSGAAVDRRELMELLAPEGEYVDCTQQDVGDAISAMVLNRSDVIASFDDMLCRAAEVFQFTVEPSCPLDGEADSNA